MNFANMTIEQMTQTFESTSWRQTGANTYSFGPNMFENKAASGINKKKLIDFKCNDLTSKYDGYESIQGYSNTDRHTLNKFTVYKDHINGTISDTTVQDKSNRWSKMQTDGVNDISSVTDSNDKLIARMPKKMMANGPNKMPRTIQSGISKALRNIENVGNNSQYKKIISMTDSPSTRRYRMNKTKLFSATKYYQVKENAIKEKGSHSRLPAFSGEKVLSLDAHNLEKQNISNTFQISRPSEGENHREAKILKDGEHVKNLIFAMNNSMDDQSTGLMTRAKQETTSCGESNNAIILESSKYIAESSRIVEGILKSENCHRQKPDICSFSESEKLEIQKPNISQPQGVPEKIFSHDDINFPLSAVVEKASGFCSQVKPENVRAKTACLKKFNNGSQETESADRSQIALTLEDYNCVSEADQITDGVGTVPNLNKPYQTINKTENVLQREEAMPWVTSSEGLKYIDHRIDIAAEKLAQLQKLQEYKPKNILAPITYESSSMVSKTPNKILSISQSTAASSIQLDGVFRTPKIAEVNTSTVLELKPSLQQNAIPKLKKKKTACLILMVSIIWSHRLLQDTQFYRKIRRQTWKQIDFVFLLIHR